MFHLLYIYCLFVFLFVGCCVGGVVIFGGLFLLGVVLFGLCVFVAGVIFGAVLVCWVGVV